MKSLNYSLTEAVLQISSAIFTVRHLRLEEITELQEDTYFLTQNLYGDFLTALWQSSEYYKEELQVKTTEKNNFILILFCCSVGVIILTLPTFLPAVISVNREKEHILALFVDIPVNHVTDLGVKCENFLNAIHDELQDDLSLPSEDGDGETLKDSNSAKRII
jgi:hypothetical protein